MKWSPQIGRILCICSLLSHHLSPPTGRRIPWNTKSSLIFYFRFSVYFSTWFQAHRYHSVTYWWIQTVYICHLHPVQLWYHTLTILCVCTKWEIVTSSTSIHYYSRKRKAALRPRLRNALTSRRGRLWISYKFTFWFTHILNINNLIYYFINLHYEIVLFVIK